MKTIIKIEIVETGDGRLTCKYECDLETIKDYQAAMAGIGHVLSQISTEPFRNDFHIDRDTDLN